MSTAGGAASPASGEARGAGAGGTPVAIGVDFGTESGRVLALELASGRELAAEEVRYPHGVIAEALPDTGEVLGHDWALQHPLDYVEVLERGIPAALKAGAFDPRRVVGLGVDFTSCTVLPALSDGTPLCTLERWRRHPHAWPKLWKHHAAQPYADRLTAVAEERGETFLSRYGGRISSEWYFPKLLQILDEDRAVYDAADVFVEATDWIVWHCTGEEVRSACAAGYKAFWSAREGLPSPEYFQAAYPELASPAAKLGTRFVPNGARAGRLRQEVAARVGLPAGIAVAAGNVDSFVSVPGAGVERPGVFVMVVGTSICDMVVHPDEVRLPGITGVVHEGILPGLYGYEAGQPAAGDMFAWYVDRLLAPGAPATVPGGGANGGGAISGQVAARADRYAELEAAAGALAPGSTGLVALDWWNGNRSVLADADLSGVLAGLTLSSRPEEVYRALLESVAFGTRRIVDNFVEHGLGIDQIVACGGIAEKSPVMMQLISDVTGRVVEVPSSPQIPARGAALFGAVAAGAEEGGFAGVAEAVAALRPPLARTYRPSRAAGETYAEVYAVYRSLHDLLGRDRVEWLHALKQIRRRVAAQ